MPKTKRAALYLRVSTGGQSVENQRLALEAVARQRGPPAIGLVANFLLDGGQFPAVPA